MSLLLRSSLTLLAGAALALGMLGPASARSAKYGGTLVVGLSGGDPNAIDPTVSTSGSALPIYRTMCLRLYEPRFDRGSIVDFPLLAASEPVLSRDKLSYTIRLRTGIQFNDGTPLNAQAVVASYQRYVTYPRSTRANDFASVASVEATGPYTVAFRLKARDSAFTGNMFPLSPTAIAKAGDAFSAGPVCAGPFMFDHWVVGDHVTVVKSPYWYRRDTVHLDKIVFRPMPNAVAASAALRAGDIQVLDNVSSTEAAAIRADPNLHVLEQPGLGWRGIVVNLGNRRGVRNLPYANVGTPLASSPGLRRAFEEAIDRVTLNRVVFGGRYQPSCTIVGPSDTPWFAPTKIACANYDPKNARKLVVTSGVSNPTVHLLTPNQTDSLRVAQFVQAQEAAVGINVVIDAAETATATATAMSGTFDAYLGGFCCYVDPNTAFAQLFATDGPRNFSGYSSPRMDYVLENGLKATDPKARAVSYRAAQQLVATDRPAIPLYAPVTIAAWSTNVTGVTVSPTSTEIRVADAQLK